MTLQLSNMYKKLLVITLVLFGSWTAKTQDDLMEMLNDEPETVEYVYATFKTTRVMNAHSIENPAKGTLLFLIQHRFGRVNTGIYELFGLDQASIRLGLEYGVTDRLSLGFGRSSFEKTYDGFLKYKILRQSKGLRKMPVTMSYYVSTAITSLKWEDIGVEERDNHFSSRVSYTHMLLIARKMNSNLSLQLTPSLVHKNLVPTAEDKNDIFSLGIGGRYKITQRLTINAEYFYTPTDQISYDFDQPFSLGLDIETGGHVFQLHFSNAKAFFDRGYLTETQGSWANGDVYFGFSISRVFTIVKPKRFQE